MSLSIVDLEKIQESEKTTTVVRQVLEIILQAINDWPSQIDSLTGYEDEVYKFIGKDIDKKKFAQYLSQMDYSKNAWVAESFSQLIEVFDYYEEGKSLQDIFRVIKEMKHEI